MGSDHRVTLEYIELVAETDLAYLLDIDGEQHWLPKSQCILHADNWEVEIPEWLCFEKGLI